MQKYTTIFYVMDAHSIELSAVASSSPCLWKYTMSLTAVAIVGKIAGGLIVPGNPYTRIAIGMSMVPRGEIGLIFAELGRVAGIFDDNVFAGIVIVIAYTTLFSPFWIRAYYRVFGDRFADYQPER
jgi:Kef-type K+ transport system membrane component KefB